MEMHSQTKGLFFISITILCWGVLAIPTKAVSAVVPSLTIAWFRLSFAFISLLSFHLIKNPRKLKIFLSPPLLAILGGLGLGGNYFGFIKGVELTSPAITQIIIQIGPMILALSGVFIFKERLSRKQLIGFVIASFGFFLFYHDQLQLFLNTQLLNTGVAWVIFGAMTWALYAIFQKILVQRGHAPNLLNLFIFGVPAFCMLPFVSWEVFAQLSLNTWLLLVFLGFNTIIAYGCLGEAFKYLPANNISILITLNPLITLLIVELIHLAALDWIPYGPMSTTGYTGAILVIFGAVIIVRYASARRPLLPKKNSIQKAST